MGHARAMLGHPNPAQLASLLERVVRSGLSVRQIETLVRSASRQTSIEGAKKVARRLTWIDELEARLRESLGRRVSLKNAKGYRGQILLEYYDREDLERLCSALAPQKKLV
jgi:ParB family chromosome partitioning protein